MSPKKKVIVVICAGKSNIRRVDDICTWTEMWKQIQTISSLDSRQNLNEQENHDRNKGKGKGMRAKGQKPQTVIFPKCVRKSFFKMGGLMSNLWKCTNQLFGAAQPIVMYKPEQWTRPYHLWEGGCTCFGAWGLSRFLFMFTPYLHNFGFISYLQLLQKKSINGSSTSWSKVHFVTETTQASEWKAADLKKKRVWWWPFSGRTPSKVCKKLVICIWHLDSSVAGLVFWKVLQL